MTDIDRAVDAFAAEVWVLQRPDGKLDSGAWHSVLTFMDYERAERKNRNAYGGMGLVRRAGLVLFNIPDADNARRAEERGKE